MKLANARCDRGRVSRRHDEAVYAVPHDAAGLVRHDGWQAGGERFVGHQGRPFREGRHDEHVCNGQKRRQLFAGEIPRFPDRVTVLSANAVYVLGLAGRPSEHELSRDCGVVPASNKVKKTFSQLETPSVDNTKSLAPSRRWAEAIECGAKSDFADRP